MKSRNFVFARPFQILLTLLLAASSAGVASGQVYDLRNDWSDSANPNGPWAYREGNNLLPQMTLSTNCGACPGGTGLIWTNPQAAWARSSGAISSDHTFLPQWFKSNGSETGLGGWGDDWEAGDVVIHSTDPENGVGGGEGNVVWTSPIAGVISISGNIWMGRDIGRANHWTLYKNNSALTGGDVSSGDAYSRTNPMPFSMGSAGPSVLDNVSVNVGDTIKLEINRTTGSGDVVGINLTINAQCDWVQWTNGHYYKLVVQTNGIVWSNAVLAAQAQGGYLATITSAEENAFVYSVATGKPAAWYFNVFNCAIGPWLGGFQTNGSPEPSGGWSWITGEPFTYLNWSPGEPSNSGGTEHNLHLFICGGAPTGPYWNDITDYAEVRSYMIERDTTPECISGVATLLAASQNGIIYRYQIGQFGGVTGLPAITNSSLNAPAGLGINPNGELFVANRYGVGAGNGSVSRFLDPAGTPLFNGVISNGFNTPHGVAFRDSELLAVDSWNNRVRRYTVAANGTTTELTPITTGLAGTAPRYVRVAADNEVFVSQCNCGGQNDVRRFLISGETITPNGTITGNGINNPHGIVFRSSGEMFVANYDGNSISRFTFSNGVAIANGTITGNGLSNPVGLAFSPWGELFVANTTATLISRWTFASNGTATANGTITVPQSVGDLIFVNSAGGQSVFVPSCTNLTVTLSAAYTNCVVSTNYFTNSVVVTTSLIDWLKADGDVVDASGNGNTGNAISVGYEAGQFGQAFSISELPWGENASARRVDLGPLTQLYAATGLTMSAWVKLPPPASPSTTNWTYLFTHPARLLNAPVTNNVGYGLFVSPSVGISSRQPAYAIGFHDGTEATVGGTTAFPSNQWVHLAVTWSSGSGALRLYRNGALETATTAGTGKTLPTAAQRSPLGPALSAELGVWDFVSDVDGALARYGGSAAAIDDFRLYTRALGSNEVQLIYNGEPSVITNNISTNCAPIDAVTTNLTFCAAPSGKLRAFSTSSNAVELRWASLTNAYYLLEGVVEMPPVNWSNRWGIGAGNGTNISIFESTVGRPQSYYRLFTTE